MTWDESKHPRIPRGNAGGGQFAATSFSSKLSSSERTAVESFQENEFRKINGYLRKDKTIVSEIESEALGSGVKGVNRQIAGIDGAIGKSVVTSPTVVYRGTRQAELANNPKLADKLVGREIGGSGGYISTSMGSNWAADFAGSAGTGGVLYEIHLPKGLNALEMGMVTPKHVYAREREILLGRNQRFRITGVTRKHGMTTLVMDALP